MNFKTNTRYIASRNTQSHYRVTIGSTALISSFDRNDDFHRAKH